MINYSNVFPLRRALGRHSDLGQRFRGRFFPFIVAFIAVVALANV